MHNFELDIALKLRDHFGRAMFEGPVPTVSFAAFAVEMPCQAVSVDAFVDKIADAVKESIKDQRMGDKVSIGGVWAQRIQREDLMIYSAKVMLKFYEDERPPNCEESNNASLDLSLKLRERCGRDMFEKPTPSEIITDDETLTVEVACPPRSVDELVTQIARWVEMTNVVDGRKWISSLRAKCAKNADGVVTYVVAVLVQFLRQVQESDTFSDSSDE